FLLVGSGLLSFHGLAGDLTEDSKKDLKLLIISTCLSFKRCKSIKTAHAKKDFNVVLTPDRDFLLFLNKSLFKTKKHSQVKPASAFVN
ncbi:MAG: hypothetical protein AAF849_21560, partial [Bacteroidota bacterium]